MNRIFMAATLLLAASNSYGDDATTAPNALTKATYTISGLHCPPCAKTVESSLKRVKGVASVKVDWATKSAHVALDESTVSAQQLAMAVAATPHLMGNGMSYGGRLALSVPGIKDEASAKTAEEAVRGIKGVANVSASVGRHTLSVEFAKDGTLSSKQLIDALKVAGFEASNY